MLVADVAERVHGPERRIDHAQQGAQRIIARAGSVPRLEGAPGASSQTIPACASGRTTPRFPPFSSKNSSAPSKWFGRTKPQTGPALVVASLVSSVLCRYRNHKRAGELKRGGNAATPAMFVTVAGPVTTICLGSTLF